MMLAATVSLVAALSLAACDVSLNPSTTPISVFPTRVPEDNSLPTMVAGSPAPIGLPGPTNIVQITAIPPTNLPIIVTSAPQSPAPLPTLDNNWIVLSQGLVWRTLSYSNVSNGQPVSVMVVRIDPTLAKIRVHYQPGQAYSIRDWQARLPGALAIVNANFFDPSNNALGLTVTDGTLRTAASPRDDSGLFQVQGNTARIRSVHLEPYNSGEQFDQAVQGWPLLMVSGFVAPAFNPELDNSPNRRTVVAQDNQGRILLIVTQYSNTSFTDVAQWLGQSGLDISSAVNLDGGPSSNLYLATGGPAAFTEGFNRVPVVIAVYPG